MEPHNILFNTAIVEHAQQRKALRKSLEGLRKVGCFSPLTGEVTLDADGSFMRFLQSRRLGKDVVATNVDDAIVSDPSALESYLTFMHELFHWYQHIATPYGHYS